MMINNYFFYDFTDHNKRIRIQLARAIEGVSLGTSSRWRRICVHEVCRFSIKKY